ncbi:hypothetical protein U3516DRAFT_763876 [Neocallimastix sp. 'constans']
MWRLNNHLVSCQPLLVSILDLIFPIGFGERCSCIAYTDNTDVIWQDMSTGATSA